MPLKLVPRDEWEARVPKGLLLLDSPVMFVFSMGANCAPCYNESVCKFNCRQQQKFHMEMKKMHDVRYNFMIGGDGVVYEGRGWLHAPLLPVKFKAINNKSICIGFFGNYVESTLPKVMVQAREDLVEFGIKNNYIYKDCNKWEIFTSPPTSQPSPYGTNGTDAQETTDIPTKADGEE